MLCVVCCVLCVVCCVLCVVCCVFVCVSMQTFKCMQVLCASACLRACVCVHAHVHMYTNRFHPFKPALLLSASKDESIRLWNITACVCVALFTGDGAHRGEVLSIDFHLDGQRFVSGGMDNASKVWSLQQVANTQAHTHTHTHTGTHTHTHTHAHTHTVCWHMCVGGQCR